MNLGKILLQFAVLVALFFGLWFGLRQVDWLRFTHWKQHSDKTEEKLGDLIWKAYRNNEHEIYNERTTTMVTHLVNRICRANNIDTNKIKLHLVQKNEINAFTLPNNHIVVYSGLIASCHNEEELAAVLGHEMGHMEKHHVMKKLAKEIGLTAITTVTAGRGGGEAMRRIMEMTSSTAYDRTLEREADMTSVDYLTNAGISSGPFADFLYRMSDDKETSINMSWLSTHPDSKERGIYVMEYFKKKNKTFPKIDDPDWQDAKTEMEELDKKEK